MTARLGSALALMGGLALGATGCTGARAPALPPQLAAASADVYRLGLGDKLRVNVYGEPALSGEYQVGGAGAVTMPLIGDVPAVGLSARELEAALVQRYGSGYLRSPRIAVEVYDFRPYFVLGEVQRPGRYPSTEATTVLGAIATAGGFSYRANTKRAFLRRAGTPQEYEIDLSQDVRILPGDVLRIGERYF
ncbi:polysaccharide biosynthesis/export family protein [Sphingomonas lenta]|uniref:Polysaccharide biosynthesis protein n=1 Tax=Sphingomonas lenta TaxID=1141887 RepID=A0A2A2SAR5_9SPHN|nr:polysaccharide biosynthesis/export family protein [Sphingomonas lenta]PAX06347.1 polysaccharide biosynthesis protein [Sphingomonas lenta]